jgi:hypothetical protein
MMLCSHVRSCGTVFLAEVAQTNNLEEASRVSIVSFKQYGIEPVIF